MDRNKCIEPSIAHSIVNIDQNWMCTCGTKGVDGCDVDDGNDGSGSCDDDFLVWIDARVSMADGASTKTKGSS